MVEGIDGYGEFGERDVGEMEGSMPATFSFLTKKLVLLFGHQIYLSTMRSAINHPLPLYKAAPSAKDPSSSARKRNPNVAVNFSVKQDVRGSGMMQPSKRSASRRRRHVQRDNAWHKIHLFGLGIWYHLVNHGQFEQSPSETFKDIFPLQRHHYKVFLFSPTSPQAKEQ